MVRISEDLVRRRAEHNNGVLHSLREITLHQFEIERIELLGTICRHLQILFLQNNIICKMENLHRLHELEYLNLAVNNIELIEGLERCEALNKLDLTVNFVDIDALEQSCANLKQCLLLRELFLLGNPCTLFAKWRLFVVYTLPQLQSIDGVDVSKSERILASQQSTEILCELRLASVERCRARKLEKELRDADPEKALTAHTPEARTAMYREMGEQKEAKERGDDNSGKFARPPDPIAEARRRQSIPASEGVNGELPRQRNQSRVEFSYDLQSSDERYTCTIAVPKFLDTHYIDVDIHPLWFQASFKGKLILLHLPEEVRPDQCSVQRVTTTGALVITMTRAEPSVKRINAHKTLSNIEPTNTKKNMVTRDEIRFINTRKSEAKSALLVEVKTSRRGHHHDDNEDNEDDDDDERRHIAKQYSFDESEVPSLE